MVGPREKWVKVRLSSWARGARAVSRTSLSVVRRWIGYTILLGLSQREAFLPKNNHPYKVVIGLGCSLWLGTAPDQIPFLYTSIIIWERTSTSKNLILILPNGSVPGPIFYLLSSGDMVQNLNVGDRLLENVRFPSFAGETLFILFSFLEYTIVSVWII